VKFANTIAKLKPDKLHAIKIIGFGELIKMLKTYLRRQMLIDIAK
jgi:hypothetical protein